MEQDQSMEVIIHRLAREALQSRRPRLKDRTGSCWMNRRP